MQAIGRLPVAYGSTLPPPKTSLMRLTRLNFCALAASLLLPWSLFAVVFAATSFTMHYQHPQLCWFIVILALLLVAAWGLATLMVINRKKAGDTSAEVTWYVFVTMTLLFGWLLGGSLGFANFWGNMQPYYDVTNLNVYPGVDPAKAHGQELLDAGRIMFTSTSVPDVSKSSSFKNVDEYCVAPITSSTEPLASYDFWAVGRNCCSNSQLDFHCGHYTNSRAHAGLRLIDKNHWEFFRLAVRQAEAEHKITARTPLFFEWVEDPIGEMKLLQDSGINYYILGVLMFFALQFFLVVVSAIGFAQVAKY